MSTIDAGSDHEFNRTFVIQENDQNSLKGLLWMSAGNGLCVTAFALSAGTAGLIGLTALSGLAGQDAPVSFGKMLGISAAAGMIDYLAVQFTGYCYSNAFHHYGPQFQITRK